MAGLDQRATNAQAIHGDCRAPRACLSRSSVGSGGCRLAQMVPHTWATFRLSQVAAVLRGLDAKLGQDVSSRLTYMSLYTE